jgi:hypothetical protein
MSIEFISAPRFYSDEDVRIVVLVRGSTGSPTADTEPHIAIRRLEDGFYWSGAVSAFVVGYNLNLMVQVNDTDALGVYEFTHADINQNVAEQLLVLVYPRAGDYDDTGRYYQSITLSLGVADTPVLDTILGDAAITTLAQLLTVLKVTHANKQKIDDLTKKLLFYNDQGNAVALSFDLKDAAGNASAREVFAKERT